MKRTIIMSVQAIVVMWAASYPVMASDDGCTRSHQGCIMGCDTINENYYKVQCHGACGTGLVQCRSPEKKPTNTAGFLGGI